MYKFSLSTLTCLLTIFCLLASMPFTATNSQAASASAAAATEAPPRVLALAFTKYVIKDGPIDEQYKKELESQGFEVSAASLTDTLTADYFKQFGVIILHSFPREGFAYSNSGYLAVPFEKNLTLLHDYLRQGGSIIFMPSLYDYGNAQNVVYNEFLDPYGAAQLPQQLRDAETPHHNPREGNYEVGQIVQGHPITQGLSTFLYPTNVLRFDDVYSTTPLILDDNWQVLAKGSPTSGTAKAIGNGVVGEKQTDNHNVFAIRSVEKGMLAISGIHSYYTTTKPYATEKSKGENDTGVINGVVLHGEKDGRPSDYGKLLANTYRFFAKHAATQGFGITTSPFPEQPEEQLVDAKVDWTTQTTPPSWQHRVWRQPTIDDFAVYDSLFDPKAAGKVNHYKLLVGPRTASGGGSGSVAEYKAAAIKAGYAAVLFTQHFNDMDEKSWNAFVKECKENSDDKFICLSGYQIHDDYGGEFLVLGATNFPDPTWLSEDGRRLREVNKLRFANPAAVTVSSRPGGSGIHPKMHKFYHGISAFTYDENGKLVDTGYNAWQWAAASDSNPIPISVHELTSPAQVDAAANAGFQQILPAPDIKRGIAYFCAATDLYFETPLRHYLSEGPTITDWSIFNKDLGSPKWNRLQYRMSIGLESAESLKEVKLYDRFDVVGRWLPKSTTFATTYDGPHDAQHIFFIEATDAKGKQVLSPPMRTTTSNYRLRCGDRQNWLGSLMTVYTGVMFPNVPSYRMPIKGTREGINQQNDITGSGTMAPILDFPFYSAQYQVNEIEFKTKYHNAKRRDLSFDSKPMYSVRPTDWVDGRIRTMHAWPQKQKDFAVALVTTDIQLKRDAEPEGNPVLWPEIASAIKGNNLLIIPGKEPVDLGAANNKSRDTIDLPVGSYARGYITLTPGLKLNGNNIGFPAPEADTFTVARDTQWHAEFLMLKGGKFHWKRAKDWEIDKYAQRAQFEMGFAGTPPYQFNMTQGSFTKLAYFADFTADQGGIAGTLSNPDNHVLLFDVPLRIQGLNARTTVALWRSDSEQLTYFAQWEGKGYVPLNADKTVEFYAGNIVQTDPALFVRPVIWNKSQAWFEVNNPTSRTVTTSFQTAIAIKGFLAVTKEITLEPGSSMVIREGDFK